VACVSIGAMFSSVSSASIRTHLVMHNVLDTSTNVLDATKFAMISDKVGRVLNSKDQVVQAPLETNATSKFYPKFSSIFVQFQE